MTETPATNTKFVGNDRLLFGMILGVLAFWLFAQTMLNIAPTMAADLEVQASVMNIAVSITALFSGIFIVVMGGFADRAISMLYEENRASTVPMRGIFAGSTETACGSIWSRTERTSMTATMAEPNCTGRNLPSIGYLCRDA